MKNCFLFSSLGFSYFKKIYFLCLITGLSVCSLPIYGQQAEPQQITPLQNGDKVLFIGNSFSDWNGPLPNAIQSIIKASGSGLQVDFSFKVKGMGILKEYATWESLGIMDEIKKGGWKYVVIQGWMDAIDQKDSGTLEDGTVNPLESKGWPACQDTMLKYLQIMDQEITKVGAKTILYEPQVNSWNYLEEFSKSHQTYEKLRNAVSVFYAPILDGWDAVREQFPSTVYECPNENSTGFIKYLYADCGHQNGNGMALDAMIFYSIFTHKSASTLSPLFPAKMGNPELYETFADIAYNTAKGILELNNCGFTDTQIPSTPSNLRVSNKMPDSFNLLWDASTDDVGVLGYNIYKDGELIGLSPTPQFSVSGLLPSTSYTMTVKAFDSEKKESEVSASLVVTTEPFEEVDAQGILMSWDFNGNNGNATASANNFMTGISISSPSSEISVGPVFSSSKNRPDAFCMTNQRRATLDEAIANNEYISFTIAPLQGNSISPDFISFIPFSQNNQTRNFTLMSSVKGFSSGNEIGSIVCSQQENMPVQTINITDHVGITDPIEFRIYVWGSEDQWTFFGFDDLKISGSVKTIPLPLFPTELTATNLTEEGFTLNWKAAKDAVSYEVFKNGVSCGTTSSLFMDISDVEINGHYQMTVISTNSENITSEESQPLEVVIPDLHAPSIPQNLRASGIAQNTFTLLWDACSDNVGVARYEVFMDDQSYGNTVDDYMPIPFLLPNTSHKMQVRAIDAAGNMSELSEFLIVTTLGVPVPTDLKASDISINAFNLSWEVAVENGNIDHFEIFIDGEKIGETSEKSYYISSLDENRSYSLQVRAVDASGNFSELSEVLDVKTLDGSGIDGSQTDEEIIVSPNPATSFIVIKYSGEEVYRVSIYDISGKALLDFGEVVSGTSLNVSSCPAGFYQILFEGDHRTFFKKLLIQK